MDLMKISKNLLKLCCFALCCILLVVQIMFMIELHNFEINNATAVNTVENATALAGTETGGAEKNVVNEAEMAELISKNRVIVVDPGHGKSSGAMTDEEKVASGWVLNSSGRWGEWRHWKSGTIWQDCGGSRCNGRAPSGGSCWYPIENGDRTHEPDINLRNALAAKRYLEQKNYTVRMTRTSNDENPSLTYRLKNCYPYNDINSAPDAIAYVCIHSNSGGGSGSAYLALSSGYDHAFICENYVTESNLLGSIVNNKIVTETDMGAYSGGCYEGQPDLILFHKSPIPIAYLEIGFFDNQNDIDILESESDLIGKAIADGIDEYVTNKGL